MAASLSLTLAHASAQQPRDRPAARADLVSDTGRSVGRAKFVEVPSGVLITLELSRLLPGVHALHIHETGLCDRPRFESAGGHFNPSSRAHGFQNPQGPHAGDLPNIYLPKTQFLTVELLAPGVTLGPGDRSLLDADGSALVIHSGPDDHRSDPAGVSGSRVACGVIISRPAGAPDPKVMIDIRSIMLPIPEPGDLEGRRVELSNVEVRARAGPRAFWIGSGDEQLLVVPDDRAVTDAPAGLMVDKGSRIDVAGSLGVIDETASDQTLATQWGLPSSEAEKLRLRRVFVRATRIDRAGR